MRVLPRLRYPRARQRPGVDLVKRLQPVVSGLSALP